MPRSSAILNTRFNTPSWVSFKLSMRPKSSGPMSLTVARTGWPCSPNTSHKVVGQGAKAGVSKPRSFRMAAILSLSLPVWLRPVRSPLTSAMNTGTPMRERLCAMVCKVTVLPEPVAPVIRPWRLASWGSKKQFAVALRAIKRDSDMAFL